MLFGFGLSGQAQTKQWTLEECVRYALDNNITIKLSELDVQNADIDKKDAFGRLSSISKRKCFSFLEYWFESRCYDRTFT